MTVGDTALHIAKLQPEMIDAPELEVSKSDSLPS